MFQTDDKSLKKYGVVVGYLTAYFVFTTMLYLILSFLHKLPVDWGYAHVAAVTVFIAGLGLVLKRWLG